MQRPHHAFRKDGSYAGVVIASKKQLAERGFTEGDPPVPPVTYPDLAPWAFLTFADWSGITEIVTTMIAKEKDPLYAAFLKRRFESSDYYKRTNPLIDELAPAVGLTPSQLDDLWMEAATMMKNTE